MTYDPLMTTLPRHDGAPIRLHLVLRWAWAVVWAAVTVPVVRTGLAQGRLGVVGAGCAVAACAGLTTAWFRSFDLVARGRHLPDRLGAWALAAGTSATAGTVALLGASGTQMVVLLVVTAAFALPWQASTPVTVALCTLLLLAARTCPSWREAGEAALPTLGGGTACVLARRNMEQRRETRLLERRNHELGINEERNRMARDLHDVLGHSLTVIALKSELAGRLVEAAPAQARQEIDDVQSLARTALADVRATVNNYRELSLAGELARAATTLDAAGVRAHLPVTTDVVSPELQELFAWVVREGVTNVVRHAHATRCRVSLAADAIEVVDDGVGLDGPTDGHGLEGLRHRCETNDAELAVGPGPGGTGTLLRVSAHRRPALPATPPGDAAGEAP